VISYVCCAFQAKSTPLSDGLVQDEFEKSSVNMSTYLVAFAVANFTPITKNVSETMVGLTEICVTPTSMSVQAVHVKPVL